MPTVRLTGKLTVARRGFIHIGKMEFLRCRKGGRFFDYMVSFLPFSSGRYGLHVIFQASGRASFVGEGQYSRFTNCIKNATGNVQGDVENNWG